MPTPFPRTTLPKSLQAKAKTVRLGADVPALVAHPDWQTPVPTVLWMHGRTVNKELDPGRYQRWLRAGIAAVAVDLPGHGERFNEASQSPHKTLDTFSQMVSEIDGVVQSLAELGPFDLNRLAIGGMSAGGMATLIRLCSPHPFIAAAVESTTGNLDALYFGDPELPTARPWPVNHSREDVAGLDPMQRLAGFVPIPVLAIHSEGDEVVPWAGQREFLDRLGERYESVGADPGLIEVQTYEETGAPAEHAGFGRFAAQAKDRQTEFLVRVLGATPLG
ncbi:MAG: alpha-beta hydrolase superfamily lysophospholipase [Phycisphaerales bacterium]|jgi:alpha-beta hydrolase superfamily lysophospholipase